MGGGPLPQRSAEGTPAASSPKPLEIGRRNDGRHRTQTRPRSLIRFMPSWKNNGHASEPAGPYEGRCRDHNMPLHIHNLLQYHKWVRSHSWQRRDQTIQHEHLKGSSNRTRRPPQGRLGPKPPAADDNLRYSGMLMSATALLKRSPQPTEEQIKEALVGNLCRCTGYVRIIQAVHTAAVHAAATQAAAEEGGV